MTQNVFDVLLERGFIAQTTDETAVRSMLGEGPVTVYIGYDPTANSLHVGHLFTIMALAHMQKAGHRVLALLGGGTAMVGDPSGKTELRKMLTAETIDENKKSIKTQLSAFLNMTQSQEPSPGQSLVVDNADWLMGLQYIDFLRDIGKHFSVNRMLVAEAYKQRLERGLSFIEFNYQLLQAYDFVALRRRYDCRLQMGGDDQWGNILAGVDLCRRTDGVLVHGVTFPLQTTATGAKMGKTADGAVWLSADRVTPYQYYQYWVNTHDDDVAPMLRFFTFLPMDEIQKVAALQGTELNLAKTVLAFEVTKLLHGTEEAIKAHGGAQAGFGGRGIPRDVLPSSKVPRGGAQDLQQIPTTKMTQDQLTEGVPLIELLVQCGLTKSKAEGRRLVVQGAVRLNDKKVPDPLYRVVEGDLDPNQAVVVRVGKKRIHRFIR